MSESTHTPPPASGAIVAQASANPPVDAHGFDPAEFEWRPVPRRPRADGWTPDVQRAFVEALARTGVVEQAAREVDRSVKSAYALRNAPGGEAFARAWAAACRSAADRLLDIAFTRAIEGEEVPVYDQDGIRTGVKWRYNTRLTMFLLRAYHRDRFGHAERDGGHRYAAASQPAELPIARAVAALAPATPAEPHRLMPPSMLDAHVAFARGEAARLAADPRDETEHYVPIRAPADDPRVVERAARRRAGRDRRPARE